MENNNEFCVSVDKLNVTATYTKILDVEYQCLYGKFMSPATIKRAWIFM
jgi:hypothetical protein